MSPLPPLGVFAKPASVAAGSFESIATVTVGSGGASNVEFTSIPGTYTHLQIRYIALPSASGDYSFTLRFNGDTTTTNYRYHYLFANGSSVSAGSSQNAYSGQLLGSSYPGVAVTDILDYANTNKYKTIRELSGTDNNGSGTVELYSNLWMSTSVITSIKLTISSSSIAQYSHFALYGIQGS